MDKGSPLALDAAAYGEAKGLRRGEDIIDSLAYIDTLSEAEKLAAENLIKDEVSPSTCNNLLVFCHLHLPAMP